MLKHSGRGIPVVLDVFIKPPSKEAAEYGDAKPMLGNAKRHQRSARRATRRQPYYQGTPNYAGLPDRKFSRKNIPAARISGNWARLYLCV